MRVYDAEYEEFQDWNLMLTDYIRTHYREVIFTEYVRDEGYVIAWSAL